MRVTEQVRRKKERKVRVLKETVSVCPKCVEEGKLNVIPARIIESDGKILYEKECEEHGKFQDIYWSDAELYKRAESSGGRERVPLLQRLKKRIMEITDALKTVWVL